MSVMSWVLRKVWGILPVSQVGYILTALSEVGDRELARQIACVKSIDRKIIGRYCGSLEDKLLQAYIYLKALHYFPSDPKYAHVEIGVLFGGSILLKMSLLRRFSKNQTVIAVDPLEGYYDRGVDVNTGVEVNEENFYRNMTNFGFNGTQLKVVKKYSTDPDVLPLLREYSIVTLFIDGDHSYEGIKYDWDTYSPLVERFGYVIFDDYNEPGWPDVTAFVDEIIATRSKEWRVVGLLDTTLVMQRRLFEYMDLSLAEKRNVS